MTEKKMSRRRAELLAKNITIDNWLATKGQAPADAEEVLYAHGHKCVPDGKGDYKFVCPTEGDLDGYLSYASRYKVDGVCKCFMKIELEK
jgi:hypothetical protein